MAHDIVCWKCGASLSHLPLPFGRQERCPKCGTDLHACKLCREYDVNALQQELLANPLVEDYEVQLLGDDGHAAP